MSTDDQRKLIESFLVHGLHQETEIEGIAERLSTKQLIRLSTAVFVEALERTYADRTPTNDEIRTYADHLAANYGTVDHPVKRLIVEALMRAQNGEIDLVKALSVEDLFQHQVLIAHDLFAGLNLNESRLDDFVQGALEYVDQMPSA